MRRCIGLSSTLFVLVCSGLLCLTPPSVCQASGRSVIFQDDFDGSMQPGWSWIRENPATWQLTPTSLRIELEYGDLWSTYTNNCRNLLVRPAPTADFMLEAHLVASLVANINQALIILYADDNNYLRYGLMNGSGTIYVNHVHEVGGVPQPQAHNFGTSDIYLRIQVVGPSATMFYSPNGTDWTQHATIPSLGFAVANVGLVAFDGSEPASASVADYDRFTILSDPLSAVEESGGSGRRQALTVRGNPARAGDLLYLHFATPSPGGVALCVYDAGGGLVATILHGELPAGHHVATWNGSTWNGGRSAPAGVYFLALAAGDTRATSRIVLVR